METKRYRLILFILFLLWFIYLAIDPLYRTPWAYENILTVLFIGLLIVTRNSWELSKTSYTLIFIFMCLHVFGSHYTYAETPFGFFTELFGFERNNYDRLVHFMFGFLLVYPLREVLFLRVLKMKGPWSYILPVLVILSFKGAYELIEWGAGFIFAPDHHESFLGTQGDIFDAQKDMFMGTIGAIITITAVYIKDKFKK